MGKPKHLLKGETKHKGKRPQPSPETADEFLEAGVDFESAGEKWRAGDAAKSCRFFIRALKVYDEGLQRFPSSFDLAYNKARLQLDLAQQPRLLQHYGSSSEALLEASLSSHRYALTLEPEDANTLFNTAQLQVIIVEPTVDRFSRTRQASAALEEGFSILKEALQMFEKCLSIQEKQFIDFEAQYAAAQSESLSEEPPTAVESVQLPSEDVAPSPADANQEQWAAVVEPITKSTLLDTCLASMQALALLTTLGVGSHSTLKELEAIASSLLEKSSSFVNEDTDIVEYQTDRAKLLVSIARASFLSSNISVDQYSEILTSTYSYANIDTSATALCSLADSTVDFNFALTQLSSPPTEDSNPLSTTLWTHLTTAVNALTKATKLSPAPDNLPAIHAQRADIELLRARLAEPPWEYELAKKSRETLLKNAEVFYRGAARSAEGRDGMEAEMAEDFRAKEGVAKAMLTGQTDGVDDSVVAEMRHEGLVA